MTVAERYVELCLRLVRHDDELLDFNFGPEELAERVEQEPLRAAEELVADAHSLGEETDSPYLRAQLRGLEIVARKLAGEEISYEDEVEGCYGTRPTRVPEGRFEEAHRTLDELLPPGGSLAERYQRWEDGDPVPTEKLEAVLQAMAESLRAETHQAFGLPEGETFDLELVSDKHWYAFNDYRGGLHSRMEVNTDLPISAASVVALVAHELYPGHHTERVWKEQLLYRSGEQLEESVLLYGTPQSVITEGIAVLAVDQVVNEHGAVASDVLENWGLVYEPELHRRMHAANHVLEAAVANAAILLHVDGVSTDEARAYLQQWELASEERAQKGVDFVTDRWGRAYIRTYTDGYELCRKWVAGDPQRFKRLLTEQLTPADLT